MKDKFFGLAGLLAFFFLIGWLQNREIESRASGIACRKPSGSTEKLIVILDRTGGLICSYHPVKTYGAAP